MKSVDHARGLVAKAEHDLKIARIGLEHDDAPLDTICFHLHQTAEKLLKAVLTCKDIEYPLTHDLVRLVDLGLHEFPELERFREALPEFFPYAVRMRYDEALYPSREDSLRCARQKTCGRSSAACFHRQPFPEAQSAFEQRRAI